jgi:hypothetical protein
MKKSKSGMPEDRALREFTTWYEAKRKGKARFPPKGTIGGALVVLERLKDDFDLDIDSHTAEGGSQISGASGSGVKRVLRTFGEVRPFSIEGGRTNRGLRGAMKSLLDSIRSANLDRVSTQQRKLILTALQQFLVERVREIHSQKRLKMVFHPGSTTWHTINDLLQVAADGEKEAPIAQYLVGAKLQLRFPSIAVGNESFSTADDQLGRRGDFLIGDTVFHVTIAPASGVYEKCRRNLEEGFKVYLLVPDRVLAGARVNASLSALGRITVESIESFVGQNIDELAEFSLQEASYELRELLETYNARVDKCELDKSKLIDIPTNLRPRKPGREPS